MPAPQLNQDADLHVSTDGTTFVPLNDMQSSDEGNEGNTTTVSVLMSNTPYSTSGQPNTTLTVAGLFNIADAGQVILRDAKQSGDQITFRKLYDGTNGYKIPVRVIGERRGIPNPEGFQTTAFTLARDGAAVEVGTGPVLP